MFGARTTKPQTNATLWQDTLRSLGPRNCKSGDDFPPVVCTSSISVHHNIQSHPIHGGALQTHLAALEPFPHRIASTRVSGTTQLLFFGIANPSVTRP
jgi:hypothetical protein